MYLVSFCDALDLVLWLKVQFGSGHHVERCNATKQCMFYIWYSYIGMCNSFSWKSMGLQVLFNTKVSWRQQSTVRCTPSWLLRKSHFAAQVTWNMWSFWNYWVLGLQVCATKPSYSSTGRQLGCFYSLPLGMMLCEQGSADIFGRQWFRLLWMYTQNYLHYSEELGFDCLFLQFLVLPA